MTHFCKNEHRCHIDIHLGHFIQTLVASVQTFVVLSSRLYLLHWLQSSNTMANLLWHLENVPGASSFFFFEKNKSLGIILFPKTMNGHSKHTLKVAEKFNILSTDNAVLQIYTFLSSRGNPPPPKSWLFSNVSFRVKKNEEKGAEGGGLLSYLSKGLRMRNTNVRWAAGPTPHPLWRLKIKAMDGNKAVGIKVRSVYDYSDIMQYGKWTNGYLLQQVETISTYREAKRVQRV